MEINKKTEVLVWYLATVRGGIVPIEVRTPDPRHVYVWDATKMKWIFKSRFSTAQDLESVHTYLISPDWRECKLWLLDQANELYERADAQLKIAQRRVSDVFQLGYEPGEAILGLKRALESI